MKKIFSFFTIILLIFISGQRSNSALDEARKLIGVKPEKAKELAGNILQNTNNDQIKIEALTIIINAEMFLEKSRDVIDHCNEAIQLARKGNYKYQEIKILSMLGSQYQTMMLNENAKKYLDKAENMMDSIKIPDSLTYIKGNLYNVKGMVFRDELNCEFALKYFDKALTVYSQQDNIQTFVTNRALINIQKGSCLLSEGQLDNAQKSFEQVLNADFDLGFNRYYAEICLAEIFLKKNKYEEASKLLSKIPIKEIQAEDPELSSVYFLTMTKLSNAKNNLQDFQMYMEKYGNSIKDLNQKRSKMISQLIYDSDVKNKNSMDFNQRVHLFIGFLLVISSILGLLLVRKKLS